MSQNMEEVGSKMVTSFLQARDKSILAWNRAALKKVNLEDIIDDDYEDTTIKNSQEQEDEKCIKVYLRVKGGVPYENLYQIKQDSLICKVPEGSYSTRNLKSGDAITRTYTFTRIFNSDTTQLEIFHNIVKVRLVGFMNGKNSTLFTYGASGSGKTFTIVGTPEEPGLIPRALEYIFRTLPDLDDSPKVKPLSNGTTQELGASLLRDEKHKKSAVLNATLIDKSLHAKTYRKMQERLSSEQVAEIEKTCNVSVSVWVSFAEIYNENIHDLLVLTPRGKPRTKLALGSANDQVFIKNLTTINVSNGLEAYQVLQFGIHNLKYASTAVNSHSSRSHSIFTIKLVQTSDASEDIHISRFNFCDLAGSERTKKTMNIGDRLKESNNINTSLLVLGRCMENIRSMQQLKDSRLIPFRESKLTQLFKMALLGHENIEMIVNINPSREMFDETHHALNFSAIAKEIIIDEQPKKVIKRKNRFSSLMANERPSEEDEVEKLREIVTELYTEMEHLKHEHAEEIDAEKLYVSGLYKKFYEEKIMNMKEDHRNEIEKLKEKYELEIEMLKCNDESIINISSSSEDSSTLNRSTVDYELTSLRDKISQLGEEKLQLETELLVANEKLKKITSEQSNSLNEECCRLRQEIKEKDFLLQDAHAVCKEMEEDIQKLTEEIKSWKVRYIVLEEERDKSEQFTLMCQNSCAHRFSDEEESTISQIQSESTFSQSRIRDEDKKFY